VIARDTTAKRDAGWHRPTRIAPLWTAKAGRSLLQKVNGGSSAGRFFDEHGRLSASLGSDSLERELWSAIGTSDLYRIANPIADREESDRPFEENVWVRAAVKAVAEGFQRLDLCVYPGDPSEDNDKLEAHVLHDLLASPNRVMPSPRQFWRAHAVNMKHDGECIWFMMNERGEPVQSNDDRILLELPATILPVRGALVEVKYDNQGMPSTYRYTTAFSRGDRRHSAEFPVGSVVHYRDFDPYNATRGLGDVNALERETDLYFQAFRAMDGAVRNGGDPGGFIIYDHEVDAAEMQRRQDIADEEFAGPNQRRVKLLQSSAKYVPNPTKPSDMQYQQLLTWLRDSILAGLGVPPPVVGVYDAATYNNVETAHREMFTGPNGILALATSTADSLNADLLPRLARFGTRPDEVVAFDSSHIEALQEDIGAKLDRAADIAAKGVGVAFNEGLSMQGCEVEYPEEGDRRYISNTLTELLESTAEEPGAEGEASEIAADPTSTLNGAQIASLLSIIEQVALGSLPMDTAVQIIVASFPFDEARAKRILREVESGSQEPDPTPAPPTPPTAPEDGEDLEEPEEDEDDEAGADSEQASRSTYADPEKVDEVYKSWRAVVNMSASQLEAWGETECSRKASVSPGAVIKRNVALMRKKKGEWGTKELRDANRAISFISRMKGMPKGEPVGDCPSKRDISLKNWGFDPNKGRNSLEGGETIAFARTEGQLELSKPLAKRVEKWLERYEKEQLSQLRRIANNGLRRFSIFDDNVNPAAIPEEAWDALLLSEAVWAGKLSRDVRVALREVYDFALREAAGEIGESIIDVSHPDVVEALATQQIKLAEGVTSTVTRRVRAKIADVLVKLSPAGNLRNVIKETLPELTPELKKVFGTKDARAATIAQTETGRAANIARYKQFQAAGVEEIMWVASQDEKTRVSHVAAHGTRVQLGGAFDNGLRHPHDPRGSAGEVINCRCTFRATRRRDPLDDPDLEIS